MCLRNMTEGDTSNATTHINNKHFKEFDPLKTSGSAQKRRSSGGTAGSGTLDGHFVKKQKTVTKQTSILSAKAVNKLHFLQSKFVNNAGLADTVVEDKNFREVITYCIDHARDLKGESVHISRKKHKSIQFASFQDFLTRVRGIISQSRAWYVKKTGQRQCFVVVARDVWDAITKKLNGLIIFYET